jgi:hypothetical protein
VSKTSTRRPGVRSGWAAGAGALALAFAPVLIAPALASTPAVPVSAIKDAGEAADYAAAINLTNPAERGAALEAFVAKYPASRVKGQALEQATAAYLTARDLNKVESLSNQVLAVEPNNARALAMSVFVLRAHAAAASADQVQPLADRAAAQAERGLKALDRWHAQDGASMMDAEAVRSEMSAIFNGALGYRAMMHRDYAGAKPYYLAAIKADPTSLDDVYQLAVSLLESTPADPAGFWWAGRAEALAVSTGNHDAQTVIETYAKTRYTRYHGGDEGWDVLLTQAATGLEPPARFAVTPAASPAAVAVQAIHDAPVAALSFSDWEFVLAQRDASPANKAAADKVWANIAGLQARGLHMKFQIKVIGVSPGELDGAITDDNQQTGHADLRVKLTTPLANAPPAGSTVSVTGVLTGYTPTPFAFTMEKAEVSGL